MLFIGCAHENHAKYGIHGQDIVNEYSRSCWYSLNFRNGALRSFLFIELVLQRLIICRHSIHRELLARDHGILLLRALDKGILARLIEKRDAVPLAPVVAVLLGRLDAVKRALEAVVGPAHEQVADIANDAATAAVRLIVKRDLGPRLARCPLRHHLPAGADLEPGLALALEEQGQEAPIHVRARTVVDFAVLGRLKVVQEAQRGLRVGAADVVRLDKVVVGEFEAPGQTDHELIGDGLELVHEPQRGLLEPDDVVVADPLVASHVLAKLQLVRLLLVRGASRGPDLGPALIADVLRAPGDAALGGLGQPEKSLGRAKHGVHVGLRDAVVDDSKEAHVLGGGAQLLGDFIDPVVEIRQRDLDRG